MLSSQTHIGRKNVFTITKCLNTGIKNSVKKCIRQTFLTNGMETEEIRWKVPLLLWLPLLLISIVLLFVFDVFQYNYYVIAPARFQQEFAFPGQNSDKGFLIKTPGCRIPYMDPFDKKIKKYIKQEPSPNCNGGIPALIEANISSIYMVYSSLDNYTIQDIDALQCCFQSVQRQVPKKAESDDRMTVSKECISFQDSANISDEFIKVTCTYYNATIYKDFFSFVPLKGNNNTKNRALNVLVFGLDGMSRLNFHRQMPQTLDYLLRNLSAIELLGYNKVGDNTFPNLIPALTGLTENELIKTCWNEKYNKRFDACPFIWKEYKKKGFLTSFGEDSAWMGLFNYIRKGFEKQPTDYMWGAFNRFVEHEIGNAHNMNVYDCVGARRVYRELIDYIKKFATVMDDAKNNYFAFYWESAISHDILNKPKIGDLDYYNFMRFLKENGHLNNTALFFMSDHGIRWGDIRSTYQGRMEERLPYLFIILPEWYTRQYQSAYNNLLKNTRRLTTPFDLHETLIDLVNPFNLTSFYHEKRRGYSLFSQIKPSRTCTDAGIESHWCTCQQSEEVQTNDTVVKKVAHYVIDHINGMLEGYAQCANLTLGRVLNAQVMTHGKDILQGELENKDYMVTLQTLPGEGIFEVTVRIKNDSTNTYQFEVMGTISRLNLYGKQSACISDFHLKLYCYCNSIF